MEYVLKCYLLHFVNVSIKIHKLLSKEKKKQLDLKLPLILEV